MGLLILEFLIKLVIEKGLNRIDAIYSITETDYWDRKKKKVELQTEQEVARKRSGVPLTR